MNSHLARSQRLSQILRHTPESLGLTLSPEGWVVIADLLAAWDPQDPLTRAELHRLVAADKKGRFKLSPDGLKIRAEHGHTTPVLLDHPITRPPENLYHGTTSEHGWVIKKEGLKPMTRQWVHLSAQVAEARVVGQRHGTPQIWVVAALAWARAGGIFRRTPGGVWLTADIPPTYLAPLDPL